LSDSIPYKETQTPGPIFQKNSGFAQFPVALGHLFAHAISHVNTNSEFWRITLFGKTPAGE
jgi:hypothetical protein